MKYMKSTIHHHPSLGGGWAPPLKNMSSSIGMIRNPIFLGKFKKWQPNHQPASIIIHHHPSSSIIIHLFWATPTAMDTMDTSSRPNARGARAGAGAGAGAGATCE